MIVRLTYLFLSAALLAVVGVFLLNGIAALDRNAVAAAQDLVHVGAVRIEVGLVQQSRKLTPAISDLVQDEELASDLRALALAVNVAMPPGKLAERMKVRIDDMRAKLLERVGAWPDQFSGLDGVALTDETGMVMFATPGSRFKPGEKLPVPPDPDSEELAPAFEEEPEAAAVKPPEPPPAKEAELVLTAVRGGVQSTTLARGGEIRWLTAAAVLQKSRIVGALLLETRLQSLPASPGSQAFLVLNGLPVLGKAPEGLDVAAIPATDQPTLLLQRSPAALLFGTLELPSGPFFVEPENIGVWGQRFALQHLPDAYGVVVADTSPVYADLAGLQAGTLLFLLVAWLAHAAIILLGGFRLRRGVERIGDFLGRVHQGNAEERQMSESRVPRELVRLVRLINTLVPGSEAGGVNPLPKAPSLDDVLQAQHVEEPPSDIADLDFEGITDSGSIGLKKAAVKATASSDGFESLGEEAVTAEAAVEAAESEGLGEQSSDLPELPEAMAAIEHLAEEEPPSASSKPASPKPVPASTPAPNAVWQPEPAGRNVMGSGPAAQGVALSKAPAKPPAAAPRDQLGDLLDEYSTDATTVMAISPELIAAMDSAAAVGEELTSPPAAGPAAAGTDTDAELATLVGPAGLSAPTQPAAAPPAPAKATPPNPRVAHYQEVFTAFRDAREQCGESISDLTFDKFTAKLDKTREAVIAKHRCSDVRFQVYVKDGKAGLKAVPAR